MKMKDHLTIPQAELARRLGVRPQYVWNVLHGLKRVSPERALMFEEASEGEITRFMLRPDLNKFFKG